MGLYSAHERKVLALLAEVAIPAGRLLPPGDEGTVRKLEAYLDGAPAWMVAGLRSLVWALEFAPLATHARPFSRLDRARRAKLLERWQHARLPLERQVLRALLTGLKAAHFDDPAMFERVGCTQGVPPVAAENPRWLAQVTDGREVREDMDLEADVVIVGSGAGGAALAYELALRGHAVLMLEEGRYFRRHEFNGRASQMTRMMYREGGMTVAIGNVAAPVWAGRAVGGTTVINSGTCYRTPERTFREWREEFGLEMFSSKSMEPYFERVERILGVAPAPERYLGGVARVIRRGAERLGYVHGPLQRNAPDCDGQGLCCFGCPTGAKKSADVSYVPMALDRGAMLVSSACVERIIVEGGAARGVVARCAGGGRLTARARMTALACGSLMTPVLLESNGLANSSGMVGKNLSIHPASKVMALFDEEIDMARGIPQGYCIEHFADEGIMFEGSSTPFDVTSVALPFAGPLFTEVMERYRNLASFGFMIKDSSRGRVRRGPGGKPLIFYSLNRHDVRRMQRATKVLCEIFLEAGAKRIFPSVHGFDEIGSMAQIEALGRARLRAGDLEVTAYHPLGTCRMGTDPRTSVVGPDHQTHDVPDLYVVDGSAVPSSLGVNPQVTIMAMATRAAEIMDRRLSAPASRTEDESERAATGSHAEAWA